MRILHTSDWHLGRSFHRVGMLEHQASFVDDLLRVVESERVDVVLVSGDIYDRALPPVDAVRLFDETLARLSTSRACVVLSSGNHDSAQRLGFGSRVMEAAGVFVRTGVDRVGDPVILTDEHGPVAIYPLPYLDPESVREPWGLLHRSHEMALGEAMLRVRRDLAARRHTRSVVMAHAFVANVGARLEESDSERDISVGGVSLVPTALFDKVDYVALGHLHGRHTLSDRVRYSGSPLAYSFSERHQVKGSWLVDLAADGTISTEFIAAPVPRRLVRLEGELTDLLADPTLEVDHDAWVQAVLTDDIRPVQAMERLRQRFPHTLALSFAPTTGAPTDVPRARTEGRSDHAIALDFVREVRGADATAAESALLRAAMDACCHDPELDHTQPARAQRSAGGPR